MAYQGVFTVKFWGVRGSIACSGQDTIGYGGNTSCVELRCGPHLIALDAGTGFRYLGASLAGTGPLDADLFLSHTHLDHIVGIPFFYPAFDERNRFHTWAGHLDADTQLKDALGQMMAPPLFPVPPDVFQAELIDHKFTAGETFEPRPGVVVRTAPLNHPSGATGYRFEFAGKSVCYVTDTEHEVGKPDENILGLIEKADVVIYDTTYTDEDFARFVGWGHSTWQEGVRLCRAAGAQKLVLFHHDPSHDDRTMDRIDAAARAEFDGAITAREGLVLDL